MNTTRIIKVVRKLTYATDESKAAHRINLSPTIGLMRGSTSIYKKITSIEKWHKILKETHGILPREVDIIAEDIGSIMTYL